MKHQLKILTILTAAFLSATFSLSIAQSAGAPLTNKPKALLDMCCSYNVRVFELNIFYNNLNTQTTKLITLLNRAGYTATPDYPIVLGWYNNLLASRDTYYNQILDEVNKYSPTCGQPFTPREDQTCGMAPVYAPPLPVEPEE